MLNHLNYSQLLRSEYQSKFICLFDIQWIYQNDYIIHHHYHTPYSLQYFISLGQ